MVAYFDYSDSYTNIPIKLPIQFNDRVDGVADTLSFEFFSNYDLLDDYVKNSKCRVRILTEDETTLLKEYRMVITDINRDLNSVYSDNNDYTYLYTVTLSEPTVYLQNCIKTDIAITPFAYPNNVDYVPDRVNPNIEISGKYNTLWDAYLKVITCHNLVTRNEKIYGDFNIKDYVGGATSNITIYSKNSTIKKVVGVLKVHNDYTGENYTFDVTPSMDALNDNGSTIIKTVSYTYQFVDYTARLRISYGKIYSIGNDYYCDVECTVSGTDDTHLNVLSITYELSSFGENVANPRDIKLKNVLEKVPCPTLTFVDLNTYSQLEDIFSRVGLIPYVDYNWDDKKCFMSYYYVQGETKEDGSIDTLDEISYEEICKPSDNSAESITSLVNNLVVDEDYCVYPYYGYNFIDDYDNLPTDIVVSTYPQTTREFLKGISVTTVNNEEYYSISINGAVISNYYDEAESIKEPLDYSITLPTPIKDIKAIYASKLDDNDTNTQLNFFKISDDVIVEYSIWKQLPTLQQRVMAYFVRGENEIKPAVCLVTKNEENLQGDWDWSNATLYKTLRSYTFMVVYEPMPDLTYTAYSNSTVDSTTTDIDDLPYKLTSDKQVNNILIHNQLKKDSNNISVKLVSTDTDLLNYFAGEKVYYKKTNLNIENKLGDFTTYNEMVSYTQTSNKTNLSWCIVGDKTYKWNTLYNFWELYTGDVCVITNINYMINKFEIDASFELSDKIAKNSVFSNYSDNVRVSDNLSTENVVSRDISLYKTCYLKGEVLQGDITNITTPNKIQNSSVVQMYDDWDEGLIGGGLHKLGFKLNQSSVLQINEDVGDKNKSNSIINISQNDPLFIISETIGSPTRKSKSNILPYFYDKTLYVRQFNEDYTEEYNEELVRVPFVFDFTSGYYVYILDKVVSYYDIQRGWASGIGEFGSTIKDEIGIFYDEESLISAINNQTEYFIANKIKTESGETERTVFYYITNTEGDSVLTTTTGYEYKNVICISKTKSTTFQDYTSCLPYRGADDLNIVEVLPTSSGYILNNNQFLIHSNTITQLIYPYGSNCIQGNRYNTFTTDKIKSSLPVFYTKTNSISCFTGLGSLGENQNFYVYNYLKPFGYYDPKIDIREKIMVKVQYITVPEVKENINGLNNSIIINELNNNISYMSLVFTLDDDFDTSVENIKVYTIDNQYNINDFNVDKDIATLYTTGNGTLNYNISYVGEITLKDDLIQQENKNYLITVTKDNVETPLFIMNGYYFGLNGDTTISKLAITARFK